MSDELINLITQSLAEPLGGEVVRPISREEETDRIASVIEQSTATLATALAHLQRLQATGGKRVV